MSTNVPIGLILWPERTICLHPFEATAKTVEIFYDTQNNRHMIYWSTTIPERFPESENSGDCGKDYVLV